MAEAIKTRYIERYDGGTGVILKIFKAFGKYRFTVQDGDGPNGREDTLAPFLKSGYWYNTEEQAEEDAEQALSTYENPDQDAIETVKSEEYRSFQFKIRECYGLYCYSIDLGEDIEPEYSGFKYWSQKKAETAAKKEIDCYARSF